MNMILMPFVQILLWIWFLGCTITWHFGKRILVEGMGIQSAEFAMLAIPTSRLKLSDSVYQKYASAYFGLL